jgi:hypothetical protein
MVDALDRTEVGHNVTIFAANRSVMQQKRLK